jgi:Rap1a immunity proteins
MKPIVIAALAILSLAQPASAATPPRTGNDWLAQCQEAKSTAKPQGAYPVMCLIYVRAFADALNFWAGVNPATAPVCVPDEVQSRQLLDLSLQYIKEHPADRHKPLDALITNAFFDAFPCKHASDAAR